MLYDKLLGIFRKVVGINDLHKEEVKCRIIARGYADDPPSSISNPKNVINHNFRLPSEEYALVNGKEVLVRCKVDGYYGDAFTDSPKTYDGEAGQIYEFVSGDRGDKAIFFASLNALLSQLGMIERPVHCKEGDPVKCGRELSEFIVDRFGKTRVANIGYQPGHLEACSNLFEGYATDLNPENIGEKKFGREILDGKKNEEVIKKVDVAVITGSALTNGTLPELIEWCDVYGTEPIIYGVTAKGALELLGMESFCPYSREEP